MANARPQSEIAQQLNLPTPEAVLVERIVSAAASSAAPTPFVGEDDLGAVVVERGRMPVGEAGIDRGIHALRIERVGNIEEDPVPRTRAGGYVALGKYGDVVALVGAPRPLRIVSVIAAAPQAGEVARFRVGKDGRTRYDARLCRVFYGNLDDVYAEKRRAVVARRAVDAAG